MGSRYSKVQSTLFNSDKFRELNEFEKNVYVYLLICPHGNSAGFYLLREGYAITDLDCTMQKYKSALEKIATVGLIEVDGEIIFIRQFLKFNPYTNDSHAKGSEKEIRDFRTSNLYAMFYKEVSTHCSKYLKWFKQPIDSLSTDCVENVDSVDAGREHQNQDLYQDQNHDQEGDQEESVPDGTVTDHNKDIYDHYLTLELVQHRELTKEMCNAIDIARRRGNYDWDMLKTLLDRHAYVVKLTAGNGDFKVKARPLIEFFGQKVKDGTALICSEYANDGAKWLRYKDGNTGKKQGSGNQFLDMLNQEAMNE